MNNLIKKIPSFAFSHWLLNSFINSFYTVSLSKFPVKLEDAQAYDLQFLLVVCSLCGELGAGLGLILGGLFLLKKHL